MAFRRKDNGLDISSVGSRSSKLSGPGANGPSGLSFTSEQGRRQAKRSSSHGDAYVGTASRPANERGVKTSTKLLIVLLVVGSLALALAVGVFVYEMNVRSALKIALDTDALEAALCEDDDESGHWSVLVQTDASSAEAGHGVAVNLALVRVDSDTGGLTLLWIPVETRAYIDGHGYKTVAEAFDLEAEAGAIAAAENLAGVEVAHYFEVNDAGLQRLQSEFDGSFDSSSEDGLVDFTALVCGKILETSSDARLGQAEKIITCVSMDMAEDEFESMLASLQSVGDAGLYQQWAPSVRESDETSSYVTLDSETWTSMVARVENGLAPVADESELAQNEALRAGTTVTIWNGVGVSGVAADCEEELVALGWNVSETGNAAQYVYDETFVIYKDTADEDAAELLVADLGQGRVVRSAARYNFSTTLLVVIGSDYQPY